jgi:PAS domain S-box-containing protein
VFANEAAVRAFRTEPSRLYGRTDEEIFPAPTAAAFRENDRRAQASAAGIQTIETLQHEDGLHHSLVSKFRIPGTNGEGALVGGMAIDITERIRAEAALRESEQRYRAVVESQAEMVCRFRPDGTVLFANSAYARARGSTLEMLIGSNFWNLVAEGDRAAVRSMIEGLSPQSPEVRIENRFQTVDGERWTLWTNRALAFDLTGRLLEAQSTGIDITERKRAEEALRVSNEALRRANADLEQFAYSASHDLQEPIRNISLSSEILAVQYSHMLSGKAVNYLSFITAGAKRMEMLVKDLLAYTQSTSSQEPVTEHVDATLPLGRALGNLSAAINESGAQVSFDKLPGVRVRETQLQQLFQNLISNAIKYRRENDPPRIEIKAERQNSEWRFSVRDNGIGIQPEYTERVFGIFKRLHPEAKYTGTGIGLAICQRIVERNGGRIWVESEGIGKGSTFYFTLPAPVAVSS